MGDRQDAYAYANQAMEHVFDDQATIIAENAGDENESNINTVGHSYERSLSGAPAARHAANAFAAYLQAAIRSENPMDHDVTSKAIQQLQMWSSGQQAEPAGKEFPSKFGTTCPQGHGVVHVITFVGRVTDWTAERSVPTTSALLLADQILSATGNHTLPPTVAPVQIARPVTQFSPQPLITCARVVGPAQTPPMTSTTIVDLNKAAHDSWIASRDEQIARAVARRVIKKGAVYAAKDQLAVSDGSGADLLLNLGGIAWEAMEKADTRHLQLLPERIEVLQITLPVGHHNLELWPAQKTDAEGTAIKQPMRIPVTVDDGRNTFVLGFRPRGEFKGRILTSNGETFSQP